MRLFWLCMHGLVVATIALSGLLIPLLLSLLEDCKHRGEWGSEMLFHGQMWKPQIKHFELSLVKVHCM